MTEALRLPRKQSLLLLAIFAVHGIFAQTIRYVNASLASGLNNGTSWANAYKDLQPALAAAQTGDQIWVAKGTYYPTTSTIDRTVSFVMKNNVGIYGGFAGGETALGQRDWKNNLTTLSGDIDHATDPLVVTGSGSTLSITGNAGNSYNVILNNANSLNNTALLDGFFIIGGNTDGGNTSGSGGGMLNISSSPSLANLLFSANHATTGGGVHNQNSSPNVANCIFVKNNAVVGAGMRSVSSSTSITNCIFFGNNASNEGGGIDNFMSSISLVNSILFGNYATTFGGGIEDLSSSSAPTFKNNIIWGNYPNGFETFLNSNPPITYSNIQGNVFTGTGNISQDPKFVNAANPAGADGIFGTADDGLALLPCSPSINTGSNAALPSGTTTDITGANRIQGSTVDMGAYEFTGSNNGNPTSADFMAVNADVSNTTITSGQIITLMVDGSSCKSIATLQSTGGSPVNGNIAAKVWVDANVQADATGKPYLQRHYQITPANNAATGTATVTLYFLQSEFTAYNTTANVANGIYPKLPIDITDAANNRNNLKFIKIGGTSNDGSGAPNTYNGTATLLTPTSVVYKSTTDRWEATFNVVGFSGFFGTTGNTVLPVSWLSVTATPSGQQQAKISWHVSEVNVASYSIEKSIDGISFTAIGNVNSKGDGTNSYFFTDASLAQGGITFYRITQTDKDGKIGYSAIVRLTTIDRQLFSIYPNPAKNILHIATSGIKGDVQVIDVVGHVLTSVTITGNKTDIDITRLAIGTYYSKAGGKSILFVKE